jgi:hypothetical protein
MQSILHSERAERIGQILTDWREVMNTTRAASSESKQPSLLQAAPLVYVVDDDVSVRESLELLIRCEGWQPELGPLRLGCRQRNLSQLSLLA